MMVDEPLTSLSSAESAIITGVLRELVNQDRNVIVTMHQPPASVFSVVDTLVLLSQGACLLCLYGFTICSYLFVWMDFAIFRTCYFYGYGRKSGQFFPQISQA